MNMDKIKNWLKEINEINKYYAKEKRNLFFFIAVFYSLPLAIVFNPMSNIKLSSFYYILFLIISVNAVVSLLFITILKIEKYRQRHKNSFFNKFLNKIEKFEPYFKKDKNIIKGTILHIFRIFIFLLLTIILFKISISIKFEFSLLIIYIFGAMICSILLLNSIHIFLNDVVLLIKEKRSIL